VAAVPGVQHVAAVSVGTGSVESVGSFSVLLASPAQYASVLAAGPLPQPPPEFTARADAPGAAGLVPALASPGLAAALGHGPVSVLLDGQQPVRVQVVGQAPGMSAVTATSAGYLVLDRRVAAGLGVTPDTLMVAGSALSQPALGTAVARHAAGATVVYRSWLLAGLQAAPLRRGAYLALVLGALASACCGLLVLLLSLLLTAASRQQALARVATMGLSAAQGRLLVFIELLPQLLAALAGGLVCAVALVPALGPELSLASFTGSDSAIPVRLEPAWLAGTALALLVLALAAVTAQSLLASRDAARWLRMGE
jgi:putative ABC transport system permease protein